MATASIVIALQSISFGAPPAGIELDPSWRAVLGWAWGSGLSFGKDIVFTFGPLGFLHPDASFVARSYSAYLVGQVVLAFVCGTSLSVVLARMPRPQAIRYAIAMLAWLPWLSADTLWCWTIANVVVALHLDGRVSTSGTRRSWMLHCLAGVALGGLALIKLTLMWLAVIAICAIAASAISRRRPRDAAVAVAVFVATMAAIWLLTGQALAVFPDFISFGMEMTRGYSESMSFAPSSGTDLVGLLVVLLAGGRLLWMCWQQRLSLQASAPLVFLLALVALAWRMGFVRADTAHVWATFPLVGMALLLADPVVDPYAEKSNLRNTLLAAITFIATIVITHGLSPAGRLDRALIANAEKLIYAFNIEDVRRLNAVLVERIKAAHPLPAIRKRIGNAPVDIWSWEQGIVIAHGLNFRPRPVFQSYAAFSPALTQLNADYLEGQRAPRFVLFKLQAIDWHLPSSEDADGFESLLANYRPVLKEDGYLLFERRLSPDARSGSAHASTRSKLGSWIDVPAYATGTRMEVVTRSTVGGKFDAAIFRGTPLMLSLRSKDGRVYSFGASATALSHGFLVSPLLLNNDDVEAFLSGTHSCVITQMRLDGAVGNFGALQQPDLDVVFRPFRDVRPTAGDGPPPLAGCR